MKIYVSRSNPAITDRRIRNENQIESVLLQNGFQVIHPENMTFDEQVRAFGNASTIFAPFGAALANLVYARRQAKVIIITTKQTPEFFRLLQLNRASGYMLEPKTYKVREGKRPSESFEYEVEERALRQALDYVSSRL